MSCSVIVERKWRNISKASLQCLAYSRQLMKFFSHFLPFSNVTLRLGKIEKIGKFMLPNCTSAPLLVNCQDIFPILLQPQRWFCLFKLITSLKHITFVKKEILVIPRCTKQNANVLIILILYSFLFFIIIMIVHSFKNQIN